MIVATWWETAEWVAALSPEKGAKAYFVQHYEVHEGQPLARVKATWRLPLHKIAVSQWLVDVAREKHGDEHVALVPNAVDRDQFNAPPRGKQPVPTFGLMYQPSRYKGCDICLEALERVRREQPDVRLVAFGTGPPTPGLPLPAGAQYTRSPAQDALKHLYGSCDAWLFGSRSEGFGLPLLEAMACRTPVIATPAGAAPELVAGGGGVLVRPEDPEDMARAIARVARMTDAQWRAMSDAALVMASAYGWEESTDLFEAALQCAIESTRYQHRGQAA